MATIQNFGFAINIFFPDGDPDGFRTIEKPGWTGMGIVCPRSLFPEKKKEAEFQKRGVYLLIGVDDDDETEKAKIYIGQGESVITRLNEHHTKKDFWGTLVFFTSTCTHLNTAHIEYLESRLITLALEAKQCKLDNSNAPALKQLSPQEIAFAENFLSNMLQFFPVLGIRVFEKPAEKAHDRKIKLLYIKSERINIQATGYETENGFVVCKGSQALVKEKQSIQNWTKSERVFLLANSVLREENGFYVFTQDYEFNSISRAASVVLASHLSGPMYWQDENKVTVKELWQRESVT